MWGPGASGALIPNSGLGRCDAPYSLLPGCVFSGRLVLSVMFPPMWTAAIVWVILARDRGNSPAIAANKCVGDSTPWGEPGARGLAGFEDLLEVLQVLAHGGAHHW